MQLVSGTHSSGFKYSWEDMLKQNEIQPLQYVAIIVRRCYDLVTSSSAVMLLAFSCPQSTAAYFTMAIRCFRFTCKC